VGCEKEMIRELGGMRKVRLVRGMKRLIKSTDLGPEWRWDRGCWGNFFIFLFLWHM